MMESKELHSKDIHDFENKVKRVKAKIIEFRGTDADKILDNDIWMRAVTQIEDKDEYLVARYAAEKELRGEQSSE